MILFLRVKQDLITPTKAIKVGVFADFGASEKCIRETISALTIDLDIKPIRISGADIAYETLAVFQSDVHLENNAPAGVTPSATFLLQSNRGNGSVILCSGHPESTSGIRWLIPRAVRWTTQQKILEYLPLVVKPEKYSAEILFDKDWLKRESVLLKKLVANNKTEKISAMKELAAMGSRKFPQWLLGQLRDSDPQIRGLAAETLLDLDYRLALKDVEQAIKYEQDEKIKQLMEQVLRKLKFSEL